MSKSQDINKDPILTAIVRGIGKQEDDGLTIITMDQVEDALPQEIFQVMPTDTNVDLIMSDEGGVMRATIYIVVGEPGVGKSTVLTDILNRIQKLNPEAKVLFISSEESLIDRAYNHSKSPSTGDVPTLFLGDYPNKKIKSKKEAVEKAFARGYDVVVVDSFKDVQDKILVDPENKMNRTQVETWLIDLMVSVASGQNVKNKFTSFLCVQQIGKGGQFVGSNSLKHNTTGMVEMRYDKDTGGRYIAFTKNRRAGAMTKMRCYYTYNEEKKEVEYGEPVDPNVEVMNDELTDALSGAVAFLEKHGKGKS